MTRKMDLRTKLLSDSDITHLAATQLSFKMINLQRIRQIQLDPTMAASCSKMEAVSHLTKDVDPTVLIQRFVKERKKIPIRVQNSQHRTTSFKITKIRLSPINLAQTTTVQSYIRVHLPAVINLQKL